jgi:glycine/D-amino acid oxidase-like deaminating enzyme/nitrite reductase/ring-hydroxylating ferredoxin subunit
MGSLHERNPSLWVGTTPETDYPPLRGEVAVDVAVIGGGITGLTTATLLKRAGATVAVIEAGRIASGTTGSTTAKVTSLHSLIYAELVKNLGVERARIYADANQAGVAWVADFVRESGIDCDLARLPALTYTDDPARVADIEAEVDAAQQLGLPASYTETTDLPYPVLAAVRFEDQLAFHPRKYCLGMAAGIPGNGSHLFEMSRATDVEDADPCVVTTEQGVMRAGHVVLATQIPFLDRGAFFAKTSPSRSYAMAVRIDGPLPEGMYLGVGEVTRSVRPHWLGEEGFLIVGGEGHKVGEDPDTRKRYETLEAWGRAQFPVRSIDYRWSAQDYMPADNVPYIGLMTLGSDRLLTATGFKKWGLSTGTFAGMILSDAILGRENPWASLFDATRVDLTHSAKSLITENLDVARRFVGDRVAAVQAPSVDELAAGEGGIVEISGEKAAASRDEEGVVHAVSPACAHLGCLVSWNTAEATWDCPCHGSRYDRDGRVIQGPSVRDLERKVPA